MRRCYSISIRLFKIGGIGMAWVAVDKNGTECLFSQKPSNSHQSGIVVREKRIIKVNGVPQEHVIIKTI